MKQAFLRKLPSRFTDKVNIHNDNDCWEWTGAKGFWGYGQYRWHRKTWLAHRVAYILYNEVEIPEGLCVLHSCDNPSCVNPSHLWLGTHADNAADRDAKGRWNGGYEGAPPGEAHGLSKLTEPEVLQIRALYITKQYTHSQLAKQFGVSGTQISRIINRQQWAHI